MYAASVRRPRGYAAWTDPSAPRPVEKDTLQCVHCNAHWFVERGSGKRRGFCMNCMGPHCGAPACWTCIPFEKRLEEIERRDAFARAAGLATK